MNKESYNIFDDIFNGGDDEHHDQRSDLGERADWGQAERQQRKDNGQKEVQVVKASELFRHNQEEEN